MSLRITYIILLFLIVIPSVGQVVTTNINEDIFSETGYSFFDPKQNAIYYDSLKNVFQKELLTGYIISTFNEIAPDIAIEYYLNNTSPIRINTDSLGRFYICTDTLPATLRLLIHDYNFYHLDTTIIWKMATKSPLVIRLQPRFKILLRCRTYAGSLPVDNANVEIIHRSDTFRTQTLSCYTDNENYWNCLYLGMFKQTIVFDDPSDSIFISFSKNGFKTKRIGLQCKDYDGTVMPVKLKYDALLPELKKSVLTFKITPPIFNNWMVNLNYIRTLEINNFNRFGLGIDGSMLISNVTTEHLTFRDFTTSQDSAYIVSKADSSYLTTSLGPVLLFNISNPLQRNFGLYAGISIPYCFESKQLFIYPFVGTRFFVDLNKALVIELKYVSYNLDVVHYNFNPYGNATRYFVNEDFRKLIVNIGLHIGF